MNHAEIIGKIAGEAALATQGGTYSRILYEAPAVAHAHEFLFFVKPEVTRLEETLPSALSMMFGKIGEFKLHVGNIRILTAGYLEKYNIIAQHYGVINAMSRQPQRELGTEAKEKFRSVYGLPVEEADVLGSLQFLDTFPSYTADSLDLLWQKSETVKLGGGTYCARIQVDSREVYLINGFHPKQLIHFTTPGRCILAFTLTGNIDWTVARNGFIGKTNPADAATGSLRNELLQRKSEFGLPAVSASLNGFHLSAGPIEGLVELIRYCSDMAAAQLKKPVDFVFGRQLADTFQSAEIDHICSNPVVNYNENPISIFDLTEEKNSDVALLKLKETLLK
jgi:hypothetical protein